ncbi:MAG: DUF427 domain-containing protein [Isosphaeraceae bacterium]
MRRVKPGPGQESVWDYPRPPRVEPSAKPVRVEFGSVVIAESSRAWRVLETSHPPVYYIPPEDVRAGCLIRQAGGSFCEWKGRADYFDVSAGGKTAKSAAWSYPEPTTAFEPIRGYVAFYASRVDACFVGDERVEPQPGDFYGGWITRDVVGPFKGGPGTLGW